VEEKKCEKLRSSLCVGFQGSLTKKGVLDPSILLLGGDIHSEKNGRGKKAVGEVCVDFSESCSWGNENYSLERQSLESNLEKGV